MMNQPILIIEDSNEDYEATVRALRKSGLNNPIFNCEDGNEALDFLLWKGNYTDKSKAPRPGIILLDLNLPGLTGQEILQQIKENNELKKIPVIILTTSDDPQDIESSYRIGANSYIKKPVNLGGFMKAIQELKDYWFEVVILPKSNSGE